MPRRVPDITKIQRAIGYRAQVPLDDIITTVIEYFRKR
jgi:nucleoside-diphosphate-sugar epimerase